MKRVLCALVLVLGCHKKDAAMGASSAGSAEVAGSATTSGAKTGTAAAGSATTGGATSGSAMMSDAAPGNAMVDSAASGPQVAAIDELDRWIAPIFKLDVPDRYRAMCRSAKTIGAKARALGEMPAPAGTDAQTWSAAADTLGEVVTSVRMCCQDLKDYERADADTKFAADINHKHCMEPLAGSFAAVAELVPGAPAPGTHASDPAMAPPK